MPDKTVTDPNATSFALRNFNLQPEADTDTSPVASVPYADYMKATSRNGDPAFHVSEEDFSKALLADGRTPEGGAAPITQNQSATVADDKSKGILDAKDTKTKDGSSDAGRKEGVSEDDADLQEDEKKLSPAGGGAGHAFSLMRKRLQEERKAHTTTKGEIAKLNEQIKALQSASGSAGSPTELAQIKTQLESITKERDGLQTILKGALYQHDPQFVAKYQGRRKALLDLAGSTLPKEISDRAKELLALPPGGARKAAYANLVGELQDDPLALQQIANWVSQMDQIGMEERAEVSEASQRWDQAQQERQNAAKTKQTETWGFLETALTEAQDPKNGLDIFYPSKDAADETDRQEAMNIARRAWGVNGQAMPPQQLATLVVWGSGFPRLLRQLMATRDKLTAAEKKIATLEGSTPRVNAGERKADNGQGERTVKPGSNWEQAVAALNPGGRF